MRNNKVLGPCPDVDWRMRDASRPGLSRDVGALFSETERLRRRVSVGVAMSVSSWEGGVERCETGSTGAYKKEIVRHGRMGRMRKEGSRSARNALK